MESIFIYHINHLTLAHTKILIMMFCYGSIFEEISRIRQRKRVPHRGAPWVVPFSKHNSERIQKDGYSAGACLKAPELEIFSRFLESVINY